MKSILSELRPFVFGCFLHCKVWSLCNQLFPLFSVNRFQTTHTFVDIMKICMWSSDGNNVDFLQNFGFLNLVSFGSFYIMEYGVLVIISSHSFQ